MTKYVIGAVGALLAALAGAWLMLAPFALAYQESGADWADPTYVDFWTGLPLVVVSVVGLILFASGLVEELRRRGILRRPYAAPAAPTEEPRATGAAAGSGAQSEMEQVLLPLVTAMLKDMQERERDGAHHQGAPDNAQQLRSAGEERRG